MLRADNPGAPGTSRRRSQDRTRAPMDGDEITGVGLQSPETGKFMPARRRGAPMFSRKNIGAEPQKCEKCGSDKVFFVQHSHGNYPILDYVCPKCDLGGDQGVPEWYMNPTGKDDAPED